MHIHHLYLDPNGYGEVLALKKTWSVFERRFEIIRILETKRCEKMANFASHFGISIRTICYDIVFLTAFHPIETVRGKNGCVKLMDGYHTYQNILSEEEQKTLNEIIPLISEPQAEVIKKLLLKCDSGSNPKT